MNDQEFEESETGYPDRERASLFDHLTGDVAPRLREPIDVSLSWFSVFELVFKFSVAFAVINAIWIVLLLIALDVL